MSETNQPFKAGFVALVGRPNVGKSTLLNAFMKQKIAAVSPRPQTTRQRQLGILTLEHTQIVFIDTPGIHIPRHKLGEYMNEVAAIALADADVIVWLVDGSGMPTEEDEIIAGKIKDLKEPPPVLLVLNKVDLIPERQIPEYTLAYQSLLPDAEAIPVSASAGYQRNRLLDRLIALLPEGEPFFDEAQVTDLYERDIAADLVREAALVHLRDEVPHGIAVRVDEFTERGENGALISATLFVERESHKGIVIGKGGEMLKLIGSTARKEIEAMSGRKVFLELRVKVNKNWRTNRDALRMLGYFTEKE
ncbi:MAG: GTPase Era [Anaerolineaceae bacterium]|jgi:GTP-binding protein Era